MIEKRSAKHLSAWSLGGHHQLTDVSLVMKLSLTWPTGDSGSIFFQTSWPNYSWFHQARLFGTNEGVPSAAWSCSWQTLQQDRSGGAARVSAHWPRFVLAFSLKKDCGSNKAAVDYFSESMWATDKITCGRKCHRQTEGVPWRFSGVE